MQFLRANKFTFLCFVLLFSGTMSYFNPLFSQIPSASEIKARYNSLDPYSISEHLAFYELYKDSDEGKKALSHAWMLLGGTHSQANLTELPFENLVSSFIHWMIHLNEENIPEIEDSSLELIEHLSTRLPNRLLKGHNLTRKEEIFQIKSEEIDLARAILLAQFDGFADASKKIRHYEAMIDLMALQILAKTTLTASPIEKIQHINDFLFYDQHFRFPRESMYAKEIDLYTFLPSVLESRKGVCLGVSILYLALSQRLGLNLEIITPPGHIYVRYRSETEVINIETTARGIHIPTDEYLGVNTYCLIPRQLREVVGMAFYNQASIYLKNQDFTKAVETYEKALPYMPDDMDLKQLLGTCYLFTGNVSEGKLFLSEVSKHTSGEEISQDTLAEDYLRGNVDIEGLKPLFYFVDDTKESIQFKLNALLKVCEKYPLFREGKFHLAVTWLQLQHPGKALEILEQLHEIDPNDITVEYYLAALNYERNRYPQAVKHLLNAEKLADLKNYKPNPLVQLHVALAINAPCLFKETN